MQTLRETTSGSRISDPAARVYRSTIGNLVKSGLLAVASLAITMFGVRAILDGRADWQTYGLVPVFMIATGILAHIAIQSARVRIVLDGEGISAITPSSRVALRWAERLTIEWISVGGNASYVVRSPRGQQIVVDDGIRGFDDLVAQLRSRMGPLPGD